MLKVKNFFDRPDIDKIDAVLIRNVKYLRTFSVQEFKDLYNIDTVKVIITEKHFIAFTFLQCLGYVAEKGVPSEPVISLMTDALGNLFYLLHDKSFHKDELMFFKTSNQAPKESVANSRGYSDDLSDCQDYVRESYADVFVGDHDVYIMGENINKDKKNTNEDKKGSWGCFIIVFLLIAAGIPAAIKGEGPIGALIVIILGLVLAYYIAKALSGKD